MAMGTTEYEECRCPFCPEERGNITMRFLLASKKVRLECRKCGFVMEKPSCGDGIVQVLENTVTGDVSLGWWKNDETANAEDEEGGDE